MSHASPCHGRGAQLRAAGGGEELRTCGAELDVAAADDGVEAAAVGLRPRRLGLGVVALKPAAVVGSVGAVDGGHHAGAEEAGHVLANERCEGLRRRGLETQTPDIDSRLSHHGLIHRGFLKRAIAWHPLHGRRVSVLVAGQSQVDGVDQLDPALLAERIDDHACGAALFALDLSERRGDANALPPCL